MNLARNRAALFFAILSALLLAVAYRLYLQNVRLAFALNDPERGANALLAADVQTIKKLHADLAAARQANSSGSAAANPGTPAAGRSGVASRSLDVLFNDPAYQKLAAIQQKAAMDRQYGPLFKALNLTAAQVDQFKTLLLERQQAQMDAITAAREQGLSLRSDPQALQQAIAAAQAGVDDQLKAALGDSGFAQYQRYNETAPEREVASQVAQALSYTSSPLSDQQSDQLVQLLASAQPASGTNEIPNTATLRLGIPGEAGTPITDQTLSQAASILSPSQLQALQQVQAEQQAAAQMRQLIQAKAATSGTTSATLIMPGG